MKRWLCALAAVLLLTLSACAGGNGKGGLCFYYRDAPGKDGHIPFGTENGAIGFEYRDINPETYSKLFEYYFAAPLDPDLESPFPKGLSCLSTSMHERILTVCLSREFNSLKGIDRSAAEACLVYTLTQFEGVDGVCLQIEGGDASDVLYARDFVLKDLGAVNTETAVRIYFSDSNGRYLAAAERRQYFSDGDQIPAYIVSQLIDGPAETEQGQLAVLPEGTALRGVNVDDNGLCTVNFSSEFLLNKPDTDLSERMTVLAVVNSLTELPQVSRVRFLVEGEPVGVYYHMDLDRSYERDESAVGKVRTDLNETDATLYVRCWDEDRLAPVPVNVRENLQSPLPERLLQCLIDFKPVNDLSPPLPEKVTVRSVVLSEGVCRVDFSAELLSVAGDAAAEQRVIRSVVWTLTSLDEVETVFITINGSSNGFSYCPLDHGFTAEEWR